jgi:hypothetical protein
MKVYANPQDYLYSGISNKDLLSYLQKLVITIDFDNVYSKKYLTNYFNGYDSKIIKYKKKINDTIGGASWLDQKISLIQLLNKPQKFNSINSGIYDT